ncbi:anti-sigma factor [Trinickia sp. NRRL B-1857]|uniref:anti-sigma factor family protein n=1 Tax=Trinickia sp. NRRL B-1857 TaxID=3162879 RepID=UPI003D2780DE
MNGESSLIPTDGLGQADLDALSAFVDGELPEGERRAIAERLVHDPRAADRVTHFRAQRAALRALFADPAAQSSGPCIVLRIRTPWWRHALVAAGSLAAGVVLAWFAGTLETYLLPPAAQSAFARQADIAYALYAPEQEHAVEVAATREGTVVSWLSKRLNRPLTVPSLAEYGYAFLGGRLLPGSAGPAAQFMYENGHGERLALYVSAASLAQAPVRLWRDGDRRTFYWASRRTAYALSGEIPGDRLRAIAVDVCGDLGGRPEQWR